MSLIGIKFHYNAAWRIVDEAAFVIATTAEIHPSPASAVDIRTVNVGAQKKADQKRWRLNENPLHSQ